MYLSPQHQPFGSFDLPVSTQNDVQAICAWPLSGQYGPGSRILYYGLVALCVFARRREWLRGACLAAALLFPSVSAIHAIVLVSVDTKGGVDLDLFGTFQLIAIGILAAPITVRYSKTYWNTPGRNIVFLWTILNLAGMLSLVVGFYRAQPQPCLVDTSGNNVTIDSFRNGVTLCDIQCTSKLSALRQGTQNDPFFIMAPYRGLSLDTVTLLSAACCIPAILSLLFMWQKVREANRWVSPGWRAPNPPPTPLPPRARLSRKQEDFMEEVIRRGLGLVERIVFSICVLTIAMLGELNFWSNPMRTQVEPLSAIGQWGPITGAILAAVGSLYAVLAKPKQETPDCNCALHSTLPGVEMRQNPIEPAADHFIPVFEDTLTPPDEPHMTLETAPPERLRDRGGRIWFHERLMRAVEWFGTSAPDTETLYYAGGKYRDYPLVPGEEERNEAAHHRSMSHGSIARPASPIVRANSSSLRSSQIENAALTPPPPGQKFLTVPALSHSHTRDSTPSTGALSAL